MSIEAAATVAQSGLEAKREVAKEILGRGWVQHPDYQFNPRHSNNPDIYVSARQPYLTLVIEAAAADRTANPAFCRAEAVRHLFSHH